MNAIWPLYSFSHNIHQGSTEMPHLSKMRLHNFRHAHRNWMQITINKVGFLNFRLFVIVKVRGSKMLQIRINVFCIDVLEALCFSLLYLTTTTTVLSFYSNHTS